MLCLRPGAAPSLRLRAVAFAMLLLPEIRPVRKSVYNETMSLRKVPASATQAHTRALHPFGCVANRGAIPLMSRSLAPSGGLRRAAAHADCKRQISYVPTSL